MKRTKCIIALFLASYVFIIYPLTAISYDDNEYQRKSRAYTYLANKSFDEGDYDAAIEYAKLAEEYALLSSEFIQRLLARTEAEQQMNKARTRFTWAKNNKADVRFPESYAQAQESLQAGSIAFDSENYDVAVVCAQKTLDSLSVVTGDNDEGLAELPSQYRIRTWRGEKDCLWNIAAMPEIYGNPFLWRKLYEANKSLFPDPKNPNWVEPDILITIPSIKGEKRSGIYEPSKTYKHFKNK